MKKFIYVALPLIILLSSCASSRLYTPIGDVESMYYASINKNVWPDDIRNNGIENYYDEFIGWVGIVEEYRVENNIIHFTMKHHYYDWVEDFGYSRGPFLLSPDGEGYISGKYVLRPDMSEADIKAFVQDLFGDCIVLYGYPEEILDNGKIIIDTKYARRISKNYVNPSWIALGFTKYGRNGLER
ncbi:MAG: hypothetical protein LBI14_08195 [Treponema sp.]|jgi:hypothetical protein|nr:hypothetical protein [Treponema sp.]